MCSAEHVLKSAEIKGIKCFSRGEGENGRGTLFWGRIVKKILARG